MMLKIEMQCGLYLICRLLISKMRNDFLIPIIGRATEILISNLKEIHLFDKNYVEGLSVVRKNVG